MVLFFLRPLGSSKQISEPGVEVRVPSDRSGYHES